MVGCVFADPKHFKLSSQRSLEAAATELSHRRFVLCRRVAIVCVLTIITTFIVGIVGGIVYEKVVTEHREHEEEMRIFSPIPESTTRGMRGGVGGSVTGIALATLRDLQKMQKGSLPTLQSLRAVAFELNDIPQLKTINRVERNGETYTLYFDGGSPGEQLSFTSTTFVFIDAEGKSHLLSPDNRR